MNIQPDFAEFLRLLETHRVEYMIVGGYAVAFHGFPRFTKDIDVFFENSDANVARLRLALVDFGFQEASILPEMLRTPGKILAIGIAPVRIDLLNQIDGVTFAEARGNAVRGSYGDVQVSFIGRTDLIRNKSSTPRLKDKADVEELA
jgi:hypothetical protein